ncbi:MAG TPA: hypothetical protein VK206_25855, partial [Anaerolineales bacterium]|nr:hypothetical protein [Anaerolineales bacterium]
MKQKVLYSLSLLLVCVMILSACAPTTQAPAQAPVAPAATEVSAKPAVELTMWTWKLNHLPGLQAVAKNFESKTGIKVTVSAFNPDDAYRTKLTTSA